MRKRASNVEAFESYRITDVETPAKSYSIRRFVGGKTIADLSVYGLGVWLASFLKFNQFVASPEGGVEFVHGGRCRTCTQLSEGALIIDVV